MDLTAGDGAAAGSSAEVSGRGKEGDKKAGGGKAAKTAAASAAHGATGPSETVAEDLQIEGSAGDVPGPGSSKPPGALVKRKVGEINGGDDAASGGTTTVSAKEAPLSMYKIHTSHYITVVCFALHRKPFYCTYLF